LTSSRAHTETTPRDLAARPVGVAAVMAAVGIMFVAANLRPAVVAVAPLVDDIKASTGWSNSVTGLLTTLPVLVFGLAAPVAPRLAARFGIERTVFGSLALLVAATALRLMPSPVALFAGSALIGAGIGICNVVLPSLIKRDFAHRSGLMTGFYSMTLSGGAAAAAALTVPINHAVGGDWRMALASWGMFALAAMLVWLPQLRRVHRMELRTERVSLWRNRIAWAITVFMGTQSIIFFTFAAWLPAYLIDRGMSPSGAGAVLALGQVVGLVASLIAPIIAGRFRDQRVITGLVLLVCAVGFAGLVGTEVWPTFWVMCVFVGPGASISLALLFMVLRGSSTAQTSQISGMAQSVGYILAAVGPFAIGGLHDVTGSWAIAMTAVALMLIPQAISTAVAAKNVTIEPKSLRQN
jgi:MFS transporter, CP family, cyanate transporter